MDSRLPGSREELDKRDPEHYTKFDVFERDIIKSVTVIAAYDCTQHNPKAPCPCPTALAPFPPKTRDLFIYIHFIQAWEQWLLAHDAAFIFKNTAQGKTFFGTLQYESAQDFASAFAEHAFIPPSMLAPTGPLQTTIEAMLAFWDDRAAGWRSQYANRDAARRDLKACMPNNQGSQLYGHELDELTERHQLGQGLLITQHFDQFPPGEKEHSNTIFLLPLLPKLEDSCVHVRHKLLGVRRCHQDCDRKMPALKQSTIEEFRKGRFQGRTIVDWDFDNSQCSHIKVRYTDPVDGAS